MKTFLRILLIVEFWGIIPPIVLASDTQLEILQIQRRAAQSRLDSLKAEFDSLTAEIDREKSQPKINKPRVAALMARALAVSREVEEQEKIITRIEGNIVETKSQLIAQYSVQFDSLKNLLKAEKEEKRRLELEKQMVALAEKKLLLLPKFTQFSFDPQKVNQIQLSDVQDSLEYHIQADYLRHAQSDIEEKIHRLRIIREELENIVLLEKDMADFMEEVGDHDYLGMMIQSKMEGRKPVTASSSFIERMMAPTELVEQIRSFYVYLHRMETVDPSPKKPTWAFPPDSTSAHLDREAYVQLLKNAEKILEQYKWAIAKKLSVPYKDQ
ncbi:MAG: hypothetical protein Kow0042_18180 [Calditrichia bacterium]